MVRWFSQAKSVKLPERKVHVNFIYSHPYGLREIQEVVLSTLTAFGEWDEKPLNVWVCQNDEEWVKIHARLTPSIPEDMLKDVVIAKTPIRMAYATEETQRTTWIREKKLTQPNLIVNARRFLKSDNLIRRPLVVHELSHKFETDLGYYTPIQQTIMEFGARYQFHPLSSLYKALFLDLKLACDDISANEITIDFGLKDDLFKFEKYYLGTFNVSEYIKKEPDPISLFEKTLELSQSPIPFDHKNEESYATEIRRTTHDYYKQLGAFELGRNLEGILDRVRNPPQLSEMEKVYAEVTKRFESFI